MKTREDLIKIGEDLDRQLKEVNEKIRDFDRRTLIRCEHNYRFGDGCGMGYEIGELTYIQTHSYTEPHGCTGGDYWSEAEGMWDCPSCDHRNRLYEKPEIVKLKGLFKAVEDVHNRRD